MEITSTARDEARQRIEDEFAYRLMTDGEAWRAINRIGEQHADLTDSVMELTLIASPTAGPVRILRELDRALLGGA